MKRLLLRWILLAVSVACASAVSQAVGLGFQVNLSSGQSFSHNIGQFLTLLAGVAVLSFLNATVGRILKFLTWPISCITLGLFSLVVNAAVLWGAAMLDLGFTIKEGGIRGFAAAFVGSLLISFINGVLGVFLPDDDKEE